ncbi:MAG: hypothetical protein OES47_09680 [Acidobacteriota bacterium]|nr:hypothetical protein [Acidobacteriota bacterium]
MQTRSLPHDLGVAVGASAVLGLFSAFGDWVWARFIPDGAVVPGIVHGVLVFGILALVLGWAAGTKRATSRLLVTLPFAGLLIAAGFYPLARWMGYITALVASWTAMWVALAILSRWVAGRRESFRTALLRGLFAASLSGLAFYAISGIWTHPDPDPNYALRFVYWTFAFLPGFVSFLWGRESER